VIPPWWTDADQAEYEAILAAILDAIELHQQTCEVCVEKEAAIREKRRYALPISTWPCTFTQRLLDILFRWYSLRSLTSKAEWLRREQTSRRYRAAWDLAQS
jgi:hypothetical protein